MNWSQELRDGAQTIEQREGVHDGDDTRRRASAIGHRVVLGSVHGDVLLDVPPLTFQVERRRVDEVCRAGFSF